MTHRTTREVADLLDVPQWQIQRLYTSGMVPEPPRLARQRAIPPSHIPLLACALRDKGWLPNVDDVPLEGGDDAILI